MWIKNWSQVTAGKSAEARVQQVMGLMELLVTTLQCFTAMEPVLKLITHHGRQEKIIHSIRDGFSLKGILSEQTETEAFLQECGAYLDSEQHPPD